MIALPNHYDKINVVCYPPYTGGNFLINCLALSDDAVFLDAVLARRQLSGKFDLYAKQHYLRTQLSESCETAIWRDLGLGNGQFFGIADLSDREDFAEILGFRFDPIVSEVIKAEKNFFCICHNIRDIPSIMKLWPRARLILFTNYQNFLERRVGNYSNVKQKNLECYWHTIRSDSYPVDPPKNMHQFNQLPDWLQFELQKKFDFEIARWFDYTTENQLLWQEKVDVYVKRYEPSTMTWNVDKNYLDNKNLISNLAMVRQKFGLDSVPDDIIDWFYHEWIHTIAICTKP